VFRLCEEGLELVEVAPGIDLERDVLAQMGFRPVIRGTPRLMDAAIFRDEPMGLPRRADGRLLVGTAGGSSSARRALPALFPALQ
jgi:acyl CoA:acetate/3-ketoacid CoA transferase